MTKMTKTPDSSIIEFSLRDMCEERPPVKKGSIEVLDSGAAIYLKFEGYGDKYSQDGKGTPVVIEYHQGEVRVVVWNDINQEDMTHAISLEGAREDMRIEK